MTAQLTRRPRADPFVAPPSFVAWREGLRRRNALPVIAVAGSRGKSTVVRLLESVFRRAGLRVATWTDAGVEVDGRRQPGELKPWSRALARLTEGTLDVAVQELHWDTIHAVGLPRSVYPVVLVTNVCGNSDACLSQPESQRALMSLPSLVGSVRAHGTLVLNADDLAVGAAAGDHRGPSILTAHRADAPLARAHLAAGGTAAWIDAGGLRFGTEHRAVSLGAPDDIDFALAGQAPFQLQNALTAAATALAVGIDPRIVAEALRHFTVPATVLPGSFNVVRLGDAIALVDRPAPPWFLRPVLRAAAHVPRDRLLIVAGRLEAVADGDLVETGRLLGRGADVLVVHSEAVAPDRSQAFRAGVALVDRPPLLVHVSTERQAIKRVIDARRPNDVALVLADQPGPVLRSLLRAADAAPALRAGRLA